MHNTMINFPSGRKTPPSKTCTMYYKTKMITIHLQCKFLQECITTTPTWRDFFQHQPCRLNSIAQHLPKPSFYSDFTTQKPLVVLQNHGQNNHATCYPFLISTFPIRKNNQDKIVIPSTIWSLSLDPHKSHKMSHQGSRNDLPIFYYG